MPILTYYGHSCVQLSDGTHTLLIDPFLTGNPTASLRATDIAACNFILVTHGHADHLGDTIKLALKHHATVIATYELANYIGKHRIKVHAMSTGGAHTFPFGRVKVTPAWHGCGGDEMDGEPVPANTPVGYVVSLGGKHVYHAGDTALFSDMKLISERTPLDVACLPIGDNFTMGVEDAARANEFLKAKICVPIHYNTFPVITADAEDFKRRIEQQDARGMVLAPGGSFEF